MRVRGGGWPALRIDRRSSARFDALPAAFARLSKRSWVILVGMDYIIAASSMAVPVRGETEMQVKAAVDPQTGTFLLDTDAELLGKTITKQAKLAIPHKAVPVRGTVLP